MGELVEQLTGDPVTRAVQAARSDQRRETLLWDLTDSIRAAASDRRSAATQNTRPSWRSRAARPAAISSSR